jgi:hypothetical protein
VDANAIQRFHLQLAEMREVVRRLLSRLEAVACQRLLNPIA